MVRPTAAFQYAASREAKDCQADGTFPIDNSLDSHFSSTHGNGDRRV